MKTTLFAFALVVTLSLSAAAANKKPSIHRAGSDAADPAAPPSANPPALCNPCLFYGGDLNVSSSNAAGMSDENTFLISGGSGTYGAVNIPSGTTANVYGILFNVQADAAFDPLVGTYDIRTGVSEGNGGTSIASGTGSVVVQPTGRNFLGLYEYTVALSWSSPVTLSSGEYWFNVEPQCLNTLDGSCYVFRQFVSNTTSQANGVHAGWQPGHEMFLNSSYFGFTWANWCDSSLGFNQYQCGFLSFGLRGTD
ncbi:MAG TPA: hypothetical protein VND65_05830 [Candidatus Binatia bacterium]|nr:hypothetical protein [Candidatus Binatia bacterium]